MDLHLSPRRRRTPRRPPDDEVAAGPAARPPAPLPRSRGLLSGDLTGLQTTEGSVPGALRDHAASGSGGDPSGRPLEPGVAEGLAAAHGGGHPLPGLLRDELEDHFGRDLAHVRVHADRRADVLARAVSATAFTTRTDIFVRAGAPGSGTAAGRELLGHEVAHVVQHAEGLARAGRVSRPGDPAEVSARAAGSAFARGRPCPPPATGPPMTSAPTTSQTGPPGVQRQEDGTSSATATRVVIIDGNVLDQVNRGNADAAAALRRLQAAGHTVYISHQAQREIVDANPDPVMRAAYRAMLDDLGITEAPPRHRGTLATRVESYHRNIGSGALSDEDVLVAAQAAAGGAEIWSYDRPYRRNQGGVRATVRGLTIAPESTESPPVSGDWDYARGRQALGLPPIAIAADGTVTRNPSPTGGTGGTGGAGGAGPPSGPAPGSAPTSGAPTSSSTTSGTVVATGVETTPAVSQTVGLSAHGQTTTATLADGSTVVVTRTGETLLGVPVRSTSGVEARDVDRMALNAAARKQLRAAITAAEQDGTSEEHLARMRADLARLTSTADPSTSRDVISRNGLDIGDEPVRTTSGQVTQRDLTAEGLRSTRTTTTAGTTPGGAGGRVTTDERSTTLDATGVTSARGTRTVDTDVAAGTAESRSDTSTTRVGLEGASRTTTSSSRTDDATGASSEASSSTTAGVASGGGRVEGSYGRTDRTSETSAAGVTTTTEDSLRGSGRVIHGASGSGVGLGVTAGHRRTDGRVETAVRSSADGSYTVNVERTSEDPVTIRITTTVHVGIGSSGSRGSARRPEQAGRDVNVAVTGAATGDVVYTRTLDEAGARRYLDDLESVRSGSTRDGRPEFGLLARVRGATTIAEADPLALTSWQSALAMDDGESIEVRGSVSGDVTVGGGGGSGGGAASRSTVGATGSVGATRARSMRVSRSGDYVNVTVTTAREDRASGSVTGGYGYVSGTVGGSGSEGQEVSVTFRLRADDARSAMRFGVVSRLGGAAALTTYADSHADLVKERSDGASRTSGTTVGASVPGVGLTMGQSSSRAEDVSRGSAAGPTGTTSGSRTVTGDLSVGGVRVARGSSTSGATATVSASDQDPTQARLGIEITQSESSSDWSAGAAEVARRLGGRRTEDAVTDVAAEGVSGILTSLLEHMTTRLVVYDLSESDVEIVARRAHDAGTWAHGNVRWQMIKDWERLRTQLVNPQPRSDWLEADPTPDKGFARRLAIGTAVADFMEAHGDHGRTAMVYVLREWGSGRGIGDFSTSRAEDVGTLWEWPPSLYDTTRVRFHRLRVEVAGLGSRFDGLGRRGETGIDEGRRAAARIRSGLEAVITEIRAENGFEQPRAKLEMVAAVQAEIRTLDRQLSRLERMAAGSSEAAVTGERTPRELAQAREAAQQEAEDQAQASLPSEQVAVDPQATRRLAEVLELLSDAKGAERRAFAQARSTMPRSLGGTLTEGGVLGGLFNGDTYRTDAMAAVHVIGDQAQLVEQWIRTIRDARNLYRATGTPEAQWRVRPGSSGPGRDLDPDLETMYRIYLDAASMHSTMGAFAGDVVRGWRAAYTSY